MNAPFQAMDLFPDLPAPPPIPKGRRSAAAARPASAAPTVAAAAPAAASTAAGAAQAGTAAAGTVAGGAAAVGDLAPGAEAQGHALTAADPEALAHLLQSHPDYRVLRRLRPCTDWPGPAAGADVAHVLVLDTETTGLDPARERIIELALLRVDVDRATGLPIGPVQVYDGLEDPGKPIPKEVVALTGITDAQVRGQSLDEPRIAQMLRGVDLVVAHNAAFDRPFAERRMAAFADLPWACSFADIDWKAQGRSSAKLEALAQSLGWFYDAHRAEMDCHALLAVLAAPLPLGGATGWTVLLRAAAQPLCVLQATQAPFEAKDKLKARGYRWNAEQRVWQTRLAGTALDAECEWLREQVYGGRRASVQLEWQDARTRYAARTGELTQRAL